MISFSGLRFYHALEKWKNYKNNPTKTFEIASKPPKSFHNPLKGH